MFNKILVLVFDDPYTAEEARIVVHHLGRQGLVDTDEVAVVTRDYDGKIRISEDFNIVPNDRRSRQAVAIIAAAITRTQSPVVIGNHGCDLLERLSQDICASRFVAEAGASLRQGTSALIILMSSDPQHYGTVVARLRCFAPRIFEETWPIELEH